MWSTINKIKNYVYVFMFTKAFIRFCIAYSYKFSTRIKSNK